MTNRNDQIMLLQDLGDLAKDAVIIFDTKENQVVYRNTNAHELTGIQIGDKPEKIEALTQSIIEQDRNYVRHQFDLFVRGQVSNEVEFRVTASDIHEKYVCGIAYNLEDGRYIVAWLRDTTRPKQHELYLVEFSAKKNTLLDTISHQMSGALNLMNHLIVEATRSIQANDITQLDNYLRLIRENSIHSMQIIDDLMNEENSKALDIFSKISRVDVVGRIGFIFKELSQSYQRRKFTFEVSKPMINVNTDEVKLLQIIVNLTSNAVKFTPESNTISLRVTETQDAVIVAVVDTGIGIPEELKPHLFEKRGPAMRTGLKGERSIGLGLSISRNLAEIINAKLWFESAIGEGTTFFLKLPKE